MSVACWSAHRKALGPKSPLVTDTHRLPLADSRNDTYTACHPTHPDGESSHRRLAMVRRAPNSQTCLSFKLPIQSGRPPQLQAPCHTFWLRKRRMR